VDALLISTFDDQLRLAEERTYEEKVAAERGSETTTIDNPRNKH
jgi:hypothetical protein